MIILSSSVDHRIVLFLLLLSSIMANPATTALSTITEFTHRHAYAPAPSVFSRPEPHAVENGHHPRQAQSKYLYQTGQANCRHRPTVCTGYLKHVLTALSSGTDHKFTKPPLLDSTDDNAQLIFKIKYAEYCKHESNYQTTKLPSRLPS